MQSPKPAPKPARPLISPIGWIGLLVWVASALVLLQLLNSFQLKAPIPGTRIPLGAGLNAIAQVIMMVSLLIGWRAARAKQFRRHRRVQTTVVMFNWLAILFVMGVTFFGPEVTLNPKGASDTLVMLEIGHGIAGTLAALSGAYLVFRMVFERVLPDWLKVRNFKRLMQITIVFWLLIAVGGLAIFGLKYLAPSSAPAVAAVTPLTPTALPPAALTPTALPPSPTPMPTPRVVSGIAAIADERATNDHLNVDLVNVPPPPSGSAYFGWLIGNSGEFRLGLGKLAPDAQGHVSLGFTSSLGANLLAQHDEFIVTLEQDQDLIVQPSEDIRFSAIIPSGPLPALRALLVTAPDTKDKDGYLVSLRHQSTLVREHLDLTHLSVDASDIAGIRRHAEHLINIVEGLHGAHFGDVDGDGRVLNPGNNYGLLSTQVGGPGLIEQVARNAQAARDALDATEQVKLHMEHTLIGAQNALQWAEQLDVKALELARTADMESAQKILGEMRPLAEALLEGVDANGNGAVEPIVGEGTVKLAYLHAQFAASPAYQATLTEGGNPLVVAQATLTPTPLPFTATPTPAPQIVQVLMKDFVFVPPVITIKAGAAVEFVNLDNAPHTATLDDNSKDTGTMNLNDKASLTFETPGEFGYFCLFHGGPGGIGMSGKIIVEP
ncbi:MAG TPA: DUF420 domain-containing protein [Anaerolineae bacterium]|nr:DUF420 domain-containing protein [Anaerolineae bacterium]